MIDEQKCWFCKIKNSHIDSNLEINIYKKIFDLPLSGGEKFIYWKKAIVYVPRCRECKIKHRKIKFLSYIGAALFFFILTPVLASLIFGTSDLGYGISAIISSSLGFIIFYKLGQKKYLNGALDENEIKDYPELKKKLREGWKIGKKPFLWNETWTRRIN